jgi:hypothetical protein
MSFLFAYEMKQFQVPYTHVTHGEASDQRWE